MIDTLKNHIPLCYLTHHFGVSRSGYYAWTIRDGDDSEKQEICTKIVSIFKASKGTYGSPRVYKDLLELGYEISENTVAKYMREMGLDARLKKKFRVMTTDSNHDGPIADRVFKAEDQLPKKPFEVLAGDITYLRLGSSFLYLAVVIDLYNREVVGWSMSRRSSTRPTGSS